MHYTNSPNQLQSTNTYKTLSVTLATTIPTIIMAAVTNTGLSPEFQLAFFNIGSAGSFCLPPPREEAFRREGEFNQSENSQRSKFLPSFVGAVVIVASSSVLLLSTTLASRPSKYSLTGPLFFEIANLVLETGTTSLAHTKAAATERRRTDPIPTNRVGGGSCGSNCVAVDVVSAIRRWAKGGCIGVWRCSAVDIPEVRDVGGRKAEGGDRVIVV